MIVSEFKICFLFKCCPLDLVLREIFLYSFADMSI